jgi:hypothetical protein
MRYFLRNGHMELIYEGSSRKSWQIDPRQLRHRYFVQVAPDGHLVGGMLQQGTRPATGRWLEIGKIYDPLPRRYFVQQTDFNTLVPGLLVQNDTPPGPRWKDIQSKALFYLINFDDVPYFIIEGNEEEPIATGEDFMNDIVIPAMDLVYPDRNPATSVRFKLFYSLDDYGVAFEDPGILVPFPTGATSTNIGYFLTGTSTFINELSTTDTAPAELIIHPDGDYGYFSFILGILDENDVISEYIYLNGILHHFLPG